MRTLGQAGLCAGLVLLTTLGAGCGSQDKTSGMELTCTSGEACDDEDPCTQDDKCDPQGTCVGTPISCDDDRPCTNDSCGKDGQCVHELQAGFCLIDGVCRTDGESPDGEPCKECMTAASTSAWTNDDTNPCGQDDQCHTGAQCKTGVCIPGELSVDCNDNNPCTDDTCDPASGCQNLQNTEPCEGGVCVDGECKCVPACEGKECGDDDCGGTCGQCGDLEACSEDGECTCLFAECEGVCCAETAVCSEGICCAPDCSGKECGEDGCSGTCGACGDLEACSEVGACECAFADCAGTCCTENALCVEGSCCTPDCGGKECGDDGCTGSCGQCALLETCSEEGTCQCLFADCAGICCDVGMVCTDGACCAPDCAGKLCGDDGCGGECGPCGEGFVCNEDVCEECTPSCADKECGYDGCQGACGECNVEDVCYFGQCEKTIILSDSGQSNCYDATGIIGCPVAGAPFYGQDANYAGSPLTFGKGANGTVTDLHTGLEWAKCMGGQTPPNCFGQALKVTWQEAIEHCALNEDGLPGVGWRLASRNELLSIVHVAEVGCVPSDYFVGIPDYVWTGTESPFEPQKIAYVISFGTCAAGSGWNKDEQPAYFRCVRGAPLSFGLLVGNNDGTASDLSTGLMWQEKDDGLERDWEQALEYCETLVLAGEADWRLPNAREIMTLMDYTLPNASIYEGLFPGAGQKKYWTGTTLTCCVDAAYAVNHDAAIGYCDQKKTLPMNVRCVR